MKEALNIQPGYEVEDFSSANDLSTFLSTISAGLVIVSLRDKNDLIQIATFMKVAKKVAKDTAFKVVVINFSGDKTYEKAIAKLGIQDLVEPGINTKALKFKLDFWMKSLNAQVRNNPNAQSQKGVKSLDANKVVSNEKKTADPQTPVWQEPLDLEDDIWILKNEADCKKILSKWLIKLLGPGPYVGTWVEVKANHWRFDIKAEDKDMYVPGNGAWFFAGDQKPDFVWKENVWLITGDNFDLYYKDANQVVSRLKSKDKTLTICKNSLFAKTKETIIAESFDKELVFKREAEKLEDLEGKNKTDQLNGGHLSGKNKTNSNLGGNLAGETEGGEAISHDNLTQKTKTEKESKFWNGKNTYEQPGQGDGLSAKADGPKDGSNLERERKDLEHQKYYKNHNEAQKYDPVEQKERERAQQEAKGKSGPLAGKSSTDEVEKNYDNSRSKEEQQKKEKAEAERNNQLKPVQRGRTGAPSKEEEALAAQLDGKSSTDKLASHYGRPGQESQTQEAREKERREKEERIAKERSETSEKNRAEAAERERKQKEEKTSEKEKRDLSHAEKEQLEALKRAGKESSEQAATKKQTQEETQANKTKTAVEKSWEGEHDYEMKGESSTDKLASHYKSKNDEVSAKEKEKKDRGEQESSKVLPFNKTKEDKSKPKTEEEKELDEITRDAKVVSFLTQNNNKIECNLDDFFEETIIFHTQNKEIKTSGKVSLDLMFKFLEKDSKLKLEGDVVSVEGDGEGMNYVTVQVTKENATALGTFMRLYEIRQENVNEFLKKVKGL